MPSRRVILRTTGLTVGVGLAGCLSNADDPDEFGDRGAGGEADPITLESAPVTEYEYQPETETVVFEDGDERYTLPFSEWGTHEAAMIAAPAVRETLSAADITDVRVGRGRVLAETVADSEALERDSNLGVVVENTGETPFDRLVAATPRRCHVTVLFPEGDYTAVLPVLCRGQSEPS